MRHATAAHSSSAGDRERPLTEAGKAEATGMGAWLAARGWVPDRIYCSPAKRTQETMSYVSAGWQARPPATTVERLYLAEAGDYDPLLDADGTTMIIGHNPTVDDFVQSHAMGAAHMLPGSVACFEAGRLMYLQRPD